MSWRCDADFFEVGGADAAGVEFEAAAGCFQIAKVIEVAERKCQFLLGHDMKGDDFVLIEGEVMQCLDDFFRIVEEVTDEDDKPAARDAVSDFMQGGRRARCPRRASVW